MYGAVTNRSAPPVIHYHLFISSHPFSIIKSLLSHRPSRFLSISYRMYHHHYPPPTIGPCRTCTSTQRLAIPSDFALLSDFILHSASSPYSKRISLRRHLKVFFFIFLFFSRSLQLDSGLGRYHHRLSDFTVILGLAFSI